MKKLLRWLAVTATALAPSWGSAADVVTKVEDLGSLASPVTLSFGHAFNDADPARAGFQFNAGGSIVTLMPGDQFADDYRFNVGDVLATAITGTIDLSTALDLNALEVRLYRGDMLPGAALGAASPFSLLVPDAVASGTGEIRALENLLLPAGNYVMEIRGVIVGSAGGSYAGVLNMSPVPEPAGVLLGLAGFALLGLTRHRRG